ncbi:MAG: hypothetical protein DYG89_29250 [Caldilinea sp. CFX5]|nr:hypothetical protein [Caldilinea sp. CFX5]
MIGDKEKGSNAMQYPLPEKIGVPELLVGREQEFVNFNQWVKGIPRRISKSRVILARHKSSKTAFVQRLFNQSRSTINGWSNRDRANFQVRTMALPRVPTVTITRCLRGAKLRVEFL